MAVLNRLAPAIAAILASGLLAACGGGGGSDSGQVQTTDSAATNSAAAQAAGDTATDGFNRFNFRRQQLGLATFSRTGSIDIAAQGHSNYQKLNNTITHQQVEGKPGFTGAVLADRLSAAGYVFTQNIYSYGEVISATGSLSGANAAEDLITAIYHRFVIFEPVFKEAGAGSATVPNGYTYFTTNFAANGLGAGIGRGKFVNYPIANQEQVPLVFYSDREAPDPVPNQNAVGYPVSIHADITAIVLTNSFTLRPRGGAELSVKLLSSLTDTNTPSSAAAIVPLNELAANTTYDAQFIGTVDGTAVNQSWSFRTR